MAQDLDLSWFDLSKYDDVSKFTLRDWHTQLSRRVGFKVLDCSFNWVYFDGECYANIDDNFRKEEGINGRLKDVFYNEIRHEPILKDTSNQLDSPTHASHFSSTNYSPVGQALWSDVSLEIEFVKDLIETLEINNSFSYAPKRWGGSDRVYEWKGNAECMDALYRRDMLLSVPLKHSELFKDSCLLSIDLNAPTEMLMKQFKSFIKSQKAAGVKVSISEAQCKSWVSMKVLPCIDLLIYSGLKGKTIPQHKLGQLLFPISSLGVNEDFDDVGKIRRTVYGYVKKILHPKTISVLEYQLYRDFKWPPAEVLDNSCLDVFDEGYTGP